MSDSKFLKFQDKNGDALIDICDDSIQVIPTKKCPPCVPNPNYVAPNWRKRESTEPWLNEKYCKYQIAVQTSYQSLIETDLENIYNEYMEEAIEGLIVGFNKADTTDNRALIYNSMTNQAYDLPAHPMSYLKLLYSVPFDVLNPLDPAEAEDEDDQEEDSDDSQPIVVEMKADLIKEKLIRVRKAFNLYARFYRVLQFVEGGKLVFEESNKLYSVKQFDRYGDAGLWPKSSLAQLLTGLDGFLNSNDLNIFGVGKIAFGKDRATKIEFTFTSKYKLKKMRVWTIGCGGKPFVFRKKRLKPLNNQSAWKDKTAVAYFAKLDKIDQKIKAKEAPHWLDVVTEFTYPKIYQTFNWPKQENDGASDPNTALSCMGDALANNLADLGQDIMDEVLSIGDALAFQFNKDLCAKSLDKYIEKEFKFGTVMDPNAIDPTTGKMGQPKDLMSFATEQAFKQMQDDEQVFVTLCANVMSSMATGGIIPPANAQFLDNLWADGLDRLKLCGLFDLMMEAINCLLGGLSFEEAMASIIKAALRGMSMDNLGDFFIGLPPDKQEELGNLVQQKLDEGDVFRDPSGGAMEGGLGTTSDLVSGKLKHTPPWKRPKPDPAGSPEGDPDTMTKDSPAPTVPDYETGQQGSQLTRRTLAQQFDVQNNAETELSDAVIIEAYIKALIDVYSDDLLSVVDILNKYPGAQMIAKIIAMMDCPRPPILEPNVLDFLKDLELPWCRSTGAMTLPQLNNPFGWIPKLSDLTYLLWLAFKIALQRIIIAIIIKIMVKLCEILADAICKALEVVGDLAASLPAVIGGQTTFRDVIRDSICGDSASDEQIDSTIAEMFEKLGVGGAALSDQDSVIAFAGDLSSATTRAEMMNAFLGDPSNDFQTAAYNIIQFEYPQFQDAFPNKESIGDFMANCGTLIPEEVKQSMRDFLSDLPADDPFPANPSLCATPEQLEDFQDLRCQILEGRATPEQCRQMFDNLQDDLAEDLEALSGVLQNGGPLGNPEAFMPPIISEPGCDDGMLPFESEEQQAATAMVLDGELKALKKDYAEDMIGNGGLFGEWGLINMVLSDTMGQPLTAHWRKSSNNPRYVDFVTDTSDSEVPSNKVWFFFSDPAKTELQKGNFPEKVASYLQEQLKDMSITVSLKNNFKGDKSITKSFDDLGFVGLFGGIDIDKITIPDMGYNVELQTNLGAETMKVVRKGRKDEEDVRLEFKDNNKGRREHEETEWAYGFNLDTYFYDLEDVGVISNVGTSIIPLDTTRIDITNLYNPNAAYRSDIKKIMTKDQWKEYKKKFKQSGDVPIIYDRLYEFLAVDNTFRDFDSNEYPSFAACFNSQQSHSPPVYLLTDLINRLPQNSTTPASDAIKEHIQKVKARVFDNFKSEIAANSQAFEYGAKYDSLVEEDAEYLVRDGQTLSPGGTPYAEAEVEDDDGGRRSIRNSDMILGVSRDQLTRGNNARVYYLDPTTYGGSYTNPGVYIKPIQYEGYLGMVNVMFPEFSPCKPRNTDLVDFASISQEISSIYNQIPEDERLQSDPDCVTEVPYNRILTRAGKAGIQGLIQAACRIYASVHYLKSYATFSTFKPDFENVYSSIYPQYIVENMERSFKDAQGAGWEAFNTFKDDEFWYAFLEQAVQTYARLVDDGLIVDPPEPVLQALFRINDAQESYHYPRITDQRNDVKKGNQLQETDAPFRWPFKSRGLKLYRDEKNFEAIQAIEEDAKIVLKEFVIKEMDFISKKFTTNMASNGVSPKFTDIIYYILTYMTQGGESLDLDKEIVEQPSGLPTEGSGHYTGGGEFTLPDGEVYVGYYHTQLDEDRNVMYMAGDEADGTAQQTLSPFANKISIPIGDIDEWASDAVFTTSEARPFVIQKYISINGVKYNPSSAIELIRSNDSGLNISDVYPGTMELVYPLGQDQEPNEAAPPVGITGNLGVRHGLQFSVMIGGNKNTLAEVEIDMLDLKVGQAAPIEGNSKLLLCLINNLKDSKEMEYIINGVYGFKKILSILAIYNDMGFLPSIGEETVEDGDTIPKLFSLDKDPTFDSKPGLKASFPDAPANYDASYAGSNAKWASASDRNIFTPFNLDWDDWDQTLLKSSKSRIKKLFKHHYYNRKFDPIKEKDEATDFAQIFMKNLLASLKPPTGARILPWFKRRRLRDNPFNSNGEMCKKQEN